MRVVECFSDADGGFSLERRRQGYAKIFSWEWELGVSRLSKACWIFLSITLSVTKGRVSIFFWLKNLSIIGIDPDNMVWKYTRFANQTSGRICTGFMVSPTRTATESPIRIPEALTAGCIPSARGGSSSKA